MATLDSGRLRGVWADGMYFLISEATPKRCPFVNGQRWVSVTLRTAIPLRRNCRRLPPHETRPMKPAPSIAPIEENAQMPDTEDMGIYPLLSDGKLNAKQAANRLGVSVATVRRLVQRGELPAIAITSRPIFLASDLEAYIKSKRGFAKTRDDRPEVDPALPKHVLNSPFLTNARKARRAA